MALSSIPRTGSHNRTLLSIDNDNISSLVGKGLMIDTTVPVWSFKLFNVFVWVTGIKVSIILK